MRTTTIAFSPYARLVLAAGSVTALLAGCGEAPARSFAAVPVSRSVTLAPVSPSPSATPTPAPVPSPSATPTDLAGCRDGDCEARVREGDAIPIDPRLGVDEITVVGLRGDAVRLAFTGTSTVVDGVNISISRSCYNDRCRVRGAVTISTSRPGRIGDVDLRLAQVAGDAAVLVLKPATRQGG
ncbi:hypothetical protein [Microbispora sp. GKU 823]|uniref:hypothetical protein n=1 Tax=Microbispora sp. GKU 823 TaxID=1652100 RepID=UPI0009A2CB6D|nr:hypothetical protein [Microbispora sp. GKU 823]OPG11499.1 hypothetical protein B1L11_19540 [Microbispora sp. GKU 823]